jgi:hypothetical protein
MLVRLIDLELGEANCITANGLLGIQKAPTPELFKRPSNPDSRFRIFNFQEGKISRPYNQKYYHWPVTCLNLPAESAS